MDWTRWYRCNTSIPAIAKSPFIVEQNGVKYFYWCKEEAYFPLETRYMTSSYHASSLHDWIRYPKVLKLHYWNPNSTDIAGSIFFSLWATYHIAQNPSHCSVCCQLLRNTISQPWHLNLVDWKQRLMHERVSSPRCPTGTQWPWNRLVIRRHMLKNLSEKEEEYELLAEAKRIESVVCDREGDASSNHWPLPNMPGGY